MRKSDIVRLLETATTELREFGDDALVMWRGRVHDARDEFVRLDAMRLCVMHVDGSGSACFRSIPAYKSLDMDSDEPSVVFGSESVFRVRNGPRRGRLLPMCRLRPDERDTADEATVFRHLYYGREHPTLVSEQGPANRDALEAIESFVDACDRGEVQACRPENAVPRLYLSCRADCRTLFLREGSDLQREVLEHRKSDARSGKAAQVLFLEDPERFARDAGTTRDGVSRLAYPYDGVYGKGIVVADPAIQGYWMRVPKSAFPIVRADVRVDPDFT